MSIRKKEGHNRRYFLLARVSFFDTHFVMLNSTNMGNVFFAPKCLYVVPDVPA